eukprot:m.214456 g.214456  ORF g.214456 m.214456 type:complete len:588 (-) comp15868_c0_seq6:3347-5110(-)
MDDSSDDDLEDVEDLDPHIAAQHLHTRTSAGKNQEIHITLGPLENSNEAKEQQRIKKAIDSQKRKEAIDLHKYQLQILAASLFQLNRICNDDILQGLILSVYPDSFITEKKKDAVGAIKNKLRWFRESFYHAIEEYSETGEEDESDPLPPHLSIWGKVLKHRKGTVPQLATLFTTLCRAYGLETRLVCSLQPCRLKKSKKRKLEDTKLTNTNKKSKGNIGKGATKEDPILIEDDESTPCLLSQLLPSIPAETNVWTEIKIKDNWRCVDCVRGIVDQPELCLGNATQPVQYVLAVSEDMKVFEVTGRYIQEWRSVASLRVDETWWRETLRIYFPNTLSEDFDTEDKNLADMAIKQGIPASFGALKQNKAFVLERHLLKNQIIHPKEPVLGFVKSEPVYPRKNVCTLHSRVYWLKKGRIVKEGEVSLLKKIRKTGCKIDQMINLDSGSLSPEDINTKLFGEWQTEQYTAKATKNGQVPVNEYGSVDLFQPFMLPKGSVHLQHPGLGKVAAELGIHAPKAIVAFEFRMGVATPVHNGVVVCQESEDILIDAWREHQKIADDQKEKEKKIVIWRHWRLLLQKLLTRELVRS